LKYHSNFGWFKSSFDGFRNSSNVRDSNSFSTTVYRKPTRTDKYLDFSSHHPIAHKVSVVKTLLSRTDTLSSSPTHISDEQERIYRALTNNHYPRSFINHVIRKKPSISPSNRHTIGCTNICIAVLNIYIT